MRIPRRFRTHGVPALTAMAAICAACGPPNAGHGYGRDGNYIMRRRWDYFVRHLLGAQPPKDYEFGGRGR